ncbi:DHH family phosphoesterase [Adlercreutzia muris]|uniref:DHH family phosphoesterase n=1 Tax=Adlercreutzia muris TaxID=1796610 RepID=UPI0021D5B293|nr:DHH family phosphoesterase [Adlercreutzia muris]MCU7585140.1 DHH family phosphoesterase [Adlercreutzia muris]
MAVTPQTNTTLAAIACALRERDHFVICGHVSPDGDCLGSQLALAAALRQAGKQCACVLARDEELPRDLAFLPGFDGLVPAARYEGPCEVFVAVDVPTTERVGDAAHLQAAADLTVTVDHHAVPEAMSVLSYTDPDVASTTMLVWELAAVLGAERDRIVATCCYTGLMTDTGRFQYQNADAAAFAAAAEMVAAGAEPAVISRRIYQSRSLASILLEGRNVDHMALSADGAAALSWLSQADFEACGACKADAEPMVDVLRAIDGVEVACMLREQPDGEIRGSLRAKGDADVAAIARAFGGGGHTAAAGFTFAGTLVQAVDALAERLGIECPVRPGEGVR